jgi:hypothetical protein
MRTRTLLTILLVLIPSGYLLGFLGDPFLFIAYFFIAFYFCLFFISSILLRLIGKGQRATYIYKVSLFCTLFFLFGGWAISHYFLPHTYNPISLLGNVGIAIFTASLGWTLTRPRNKRILLPINTTFFVFFIILLISLRPRPDSRRLPAGHVRKYSAHMDAEELSSKVALRKNGREW